MSSAVVSTSAALSRPFLFDAEPEPEVGPVSAEQVRQKPVAKVLSSTISNQRSWLPAVTPASQLAIRPAPEMASSGIPELDALTGGLPRGCLTEICGSATSGRTSVLLAALAAATRRGEYCAVVDASDALDPHSLAASGADLSRVLWVRCGEDSPEKKNPPLRQKENKSEWPRVIPQAERGVEQLLRATDLLLESGGFGLIVLDLADVPPQAARRIPLTTWFRFRRAVEHKPSMLLAIEQQPIAGSCSSLLLQLGVLSTQYSVLTKNTEWTHAQLFTGLEINVERIRSRVDRKPARSIAFESKTAWAG